MTCESYLLKKIVNKIIVNDTTCEKNLFEMVIFKVAFKFLSHCYYSRFSCYSRLTNNLLYPHGYCLHVGIVCIFSCFTVQGFLMSIQTCLMLCSKTLEHMTNHYVIFIVIGLFFAGKASILTNHDTDDIMVCHVF